MTLDTKWMDVHVGKDLPPYNGRDFHKDLEWFIPLVLDLRLTGRLYYNKDFQHVPIFPSMGWMHMKLEGLEGCPDPVSKDYVALRHAWVMRLLDAMRADPRIGLVDDIACLECGRVRDVPRLIETWEVFADWLEENNWGLRADFSRQLIEVLRAGDAYDTEDSRRKIALGLQRI